MVKLGKNIFNREKLLFQFKRHRNALLFLFLSILVSRIIIHTGTPINFDVDSAYCIFLAKLTPPSQSTSASSLGTCGFLPVLDITKNGFSKVRNESSSLLLSICMLSDVLM